MAGKDEQQRVTVWRRLRHQIGTDVAAGARAIVDDNLLAEHARCALGCDPRECVAAAACRRADDQAYGFGGVRLCRGDAREAACERTENNAYDPLRQYTLHGTAPLLAHMTRVCLPVYCRRFCQNLFIQWLVLRVQPALPRAKI